MRDLELAALLCSRLCHDLVGPVGAIGNGIEILEEETDAEMQKQAAQLLGHSAEQASRRLKFYRLAFGASGGSEATLSLQEARSITGEFLQDSRVRLLWPDEATAMDPAPEKNEVKLLLNLLLIGSEAMPRGGELTVQCSNGAERTWAVLGKGPGVGFSDPVSRALDPQSASDSLVAKAAPAYLAVQLSDALGGTLDTVAESDAVRLSVRLPAH